jgi:branched-chain amino acid transport system ATP-binding protein
MRRRALSRTSAREAPDELASGNGRGSASHAQEPVPEGGSAGHVTRLCLDNVAKRFGSFAAVRSVTLDITADDVTGLIGPNGAGKTTLFGLIDGYYRADVGDILLEGKTITRLNSRQRAKRGITRTYQAARTFPRLAVAENLLLAARDPDGAPHWWESRRTALADRRAWLEEIATEVALEHALWLPAKELTEPERKRLDFAMALTSEPSVFLLDEPTAGVSADDAELMYSLLAALRKNRPGVAIIISSHDVDLVLRLATRLVVLVGGQVLADGSPGDVVADEDVQRLYLGEAAS